MILRFSWSFGLNGIPWIVSAEIFPGALRNLTGTWAAMIQWLRSLDVHFPPATDCIQVGSICNYESPTVPLQRAWLWHLVLFRFLDDCGVNLGVYFPTRDQRTHLERYGHNLVSIFAILWFLSVINPWRYSGYDRPRESLPRSVPSIRKEVVD